MIEKEQKAKRVYHRTKPASKSKVRAIRFDLDLVEFISTISPLRSLIYKSSETFSTKLSVPAESSSNAISNISPA